MYLGNPAGLNVGKAENFVVDMVCTQLGNLVETISKTLPIVWANWENGLKLKSNRYWVFTGSNGAFEVILDEGFLSRFPHNEYGRAARNHLFLAEFSLSLFYSS